MVKEDAELGRRAEQEHFGVREQGPEIDHGADADEEQQRQGLRGFDTHLEQPVDDAGNLPPKPRSFD